jgi:flavin reductase (DIM6/NTAB) family NADH-FMN oxidoreductase RutF
MDQNAFTQVLQRFPLPVTVVTVGRGGAENALTVSWVTPSRRARATPAHPS